MKKRIKEFIEYYKELGFSKIFWYLSALRILYLICGIVELEELY